MKNETELVLQQRLLSMILQWTGGFAAVVPESDQTNCSGLNEPFYDQTKLGIQNIFRGVLTHKFGDYQQGHYDGMQRKHRRCSQQEWNVAFIRSLLTYSKNMWKIQYDYVNEVTNANMESQVQNMAWKMRSILLNNIWKLRYDDRHFSVKSPNNNP